MSVKAARGTKRQCQSCNARFYDLNRDPIVCPICQTPFQLKGAAAVAHAARAAEALEEEDDDVALLGDTGDVEVVSLDEAASEEDDIPDIEGDDLEDLDADADLKDDDDALIPDDEDEDTDVTGFIGTPLDDKKDDDV